MNKHNRGWSDFQQENMETDNPSIVIGIIIGLGFTIGWIIGGFIFK